MMRFAEDSILHYKQVCGSCIPSRNSNMCRGGQQCSKVNASPKTQQSSCSEDEVLTMNQKDDSKDKSCSEKRSSRCADVHDERNIIESTEQWREPSFKKARTLQPDDVPSVNVDEPEICSVEDVDSTLKKSETSLICIDFGSMGSMGLLGDARRFLQVIMLALQQSCEYGTLLAGDLCSISH